MQLAQDQLQKKNDELIILYQEKCKKHTQMTNLYNLLKSRAMRSQIQTAASDSVSQTLKSLPQATGNTRLNGSLLPQTAMTASRHFDALPSTEKRSNKSSTERLFRHQRSGSASSKSKEDRFMADVGAMPPPQLPFSGMINPFACLEIRKSELTFLIALRSLSKSRPYAIAPSDSSSCSARVSSSPRKSGADGRTKVFCEPWAF